MAAREKAFSVRGKIAPGPRRGEPLIEHNFFQLKGILGFEPFKGTLDIKTRQLVNIAGVATKAVDRVLLDGSRHVDLYIAPVTLVIRPHEYVEIEETHTPRKKTMLDRIADLRRNQDRILVRQKQAEEMMDHPTERHDCYAVQEKQPIDRTMIEIIDQEKLKEKFSLDEGDEVEVIFYKTEKKRPSNASAFRT